MRRPAILLLGLSVLLGRADAGSWPQFRGPGGTAFPGREDKLPAQIGPEKSVVWKTALPPGHSSPVIVGDRIYLTGVRDDKLLTLALERKGGKVLWEVEAPHKVLEKIHSIGSHAQSTPVSDGTCVISLFGSTGLFCYDPEGKQLWHRPMGPFKNDFGAGSSPILVGDRLILNLDHDSDSVLLALDKTTGRVLWKTDRSEFPVGYASPVLWDNAGRKQIVVAGTLRAVGYDLDTGKEAWTVRGMSRVANMTPSIGPDGILYVAGWAAGADPGERFEIEPFEQMLAKHDKNKNGTLEQDELPEGALKNRFSLIDRDKDEHITRQEWEGMRHIFETSQNRMVAIKPGGQGDVTASHVLWEQRKYLPFVPSPLLYKDQLFLVRNGGFLAVLDPKTGVMAKQERVGGAANYYASPVGGDGKVYVFSERGEAAVLGTTAELPVLWRTRFNEDVYATPAVVDGRIYVRTAGHLYCFGE
jgi:outer membrane protein assembly factor BamB